MSEIERFEGLVEIMNRLREPGGCPWDREQTYETLRSYLIEECYEVAEALDRGDPAALKEELGDLLFQIVFLARLAQENGDFTARDVIRGIARKMIRRHPHVFGTVSAETSAAVLKNWEEIKRREKHGREEPAAPASVLAGLPRGLPALLKAQRLGTKAARVGFDWSRAADVLEKIEEELQELRRAVGRGEREAARAEIGDLLFAVVNLARHLEIDPEGALERTNLKFTRRFEWIEERLAAEGRSIDETALDDLEGLWDAAKRALADTGAAG